MLAHPRFVFRLEQAPADGEGGPDLSHRRPRPRVAAVVLPLGHGARRGAGEGREPGAARARRPAFRSRCGGCSPIRASKALATRFAAQWLRLQDVEKTRPDPLLFPQWDQTLADSLLRETELFFDSLVREDRSVLDLITADYTFVNERIAKHYGIPNVMGSNFRRVQIPDPNRRGILGHGSILLLTSVADRTSPVLRGKWVMEVLLGTPPPPPPPNVPDLDDTSGVKDARPLSVRERMEEHRKNPACTSCHRVIDPLGLALENFDATGAWRIKDNGVTVDPTGELYDGTKMDGPDALRQALLKRPECCCGTSPRT